MLRGSQSGFWHRARSFPSAWLSLTRLPRRLFAGKITTLIAVRSPPPDCAWRGHLSASENRGIARCGRRALFRSCGEQRRDGLRGPRGGAAALARCGDACQAGEARALAAALSRIAARPRMAAAGQPEPIATLIRRTLIRTSAPILSSLGANGAARCLGELV